MAELMMLKGDLEGAAKHMEDILIKKPGTFLICVTQIQYVTE